MYDRAILGHARRVAVILSALCATFIQPWSGTRQGGRNGEAGHGVFAQETEGSLNDEAVPTIMTYDEDDPFAVTFAFACGEKIVEWTFARSLLFSAFEEGASGLGDVRISLANSSTIVLLLRNGSSGVVNLLFPSDDVKMFLDQTERMVPSGGESDRLDIEAEWAEWRDGHSV
jgi:hypothetical protein